MVLILHIYNVQKHCKLPKNTKLELENSFLTPNLVLFLYWQASLTWGMFLNLHAKLSENKHSRNSHAFLRGGKHDLWKAGRQSDETWFDI